MTQGKCWSLLVLVSGKHGFGGQECDILKEREQVAVERQRLLQGSRPGEGHIYDSRWSF